MPRRFQRLRFVPSIELQRGVRAAWLLSALAVACGESDTQNDGSLDGGLSALPSAAAGASGNCSDLYDQALFPRFEVEMAEDQWQAMVDGCEGHIEEYRPIVLHFGDEARDAMIRLKGNWSWNCEKMQFVISFNEQDADARFHGLRKLVLDAPWYDQTLLHERLAFGFLSTYGGPSSCVNNAELYVNGEYYGVYANVERLDREYLERHFEDPSGNLFKQGRELVTNEESGSSAAVDAFWASQSLPELEAVLDVDQAVRVWAGEAMLPDPDSYWAGVEINFYLYEPPGERLVFLPYDADISFAENIWPDLVAMDPITHEHNEWRKEEQFRLALSDALVCEKFVAALRTARSRYDVAALEQKIDTWSAQITDAVSADPHRTFSVEEHQAALELLRTAPSRRAAFVDQWLQTTRCPVEWP